MYQSESERLWVEKYRPQTIADCILTESQRKTFEGILASGDIPNLLFTGTAGTGKTTVAKALCHQLDSDCIVINGSMNGNIDTLRTTILSFASAVSFSGSRKMVILDEADYLNPSSTMPALRGFMEEFSANCGFILTCNFKNKIIEPLHSRCSLVDFRIPKSEKQAMAAQLLTRLITILDSEKVVYNKKVLMQFMMKHFPDFRRTIGELQQYSIANGEINEGILTKSSEVNITELIKALKAKKYGEVRNWVVQNLDNDPQKIYRKVYDGLWENMEPSSIPQAVLLTADYQYKSAFVADPEINLLAYMTELMAETQWK